MLIILLSDEPTKQTKLEKKESSIYGLGVPSTSKSLLPIKEVDLSKPEIDQQFSNSSIYFESKMEFEQLNDNSPENHLSDYSNRSFSENSLEFSSEESSSEDNTSLGVITCFKISILRN